MFDFISSRYFTISHRWRHIFNSVISTCLDLYFPIGHLDDDNKINDDERRRCQRRQHHWITKKHCFSQKNMNSILRRNIFRFWSIRSCLLALRPLDSLGECSLKFQFYVAHIPNHANCVHFTVPMCVLVCVQRKFDMQYIGIYYWRQWIARGFRVRKHTLHFTPNNHFLKKRIRFICACVFS